MNLRVILLATAAVVTAGTTAFLVQGWLNQQRSQMMARAAKPAPEPAANTVLVARKTLATGTFVKAEDLRWQPWPKGEIEPTYILQGKRQADGLNGAVVRQTIVAGQPVTDLRLVKPGDRGFLAAVLTPGSRAVSVPVTAPSAVAGLVFPGDRVDLILSHRYDVPGDKGRREARRASETVLTNVRVIAIDQSTNDQKAKPSVPKTATLEVSPRQAEIVSVAMELGKLSLSLRSLARVEDDTATLSAVTATTSTEPEQAKRGRTLTRDSDVSRVIGGTKHRAQNVVRLMRGSKAADIEVEK